MKRFIPFFFPVLFIIVPFWVHSQMAEVVYEKKWHVGAAGDSLPYRILFPKKYKNGERYPLLLFLHGAGERGNDNEQQLMHGAKLFLREEVREQYPAIVVFPQCPKETTWAWLDLSSRTDKNWKVPFYEDPMPPLAAVMDLLEKLLREERVDSTRLYVSGLSMGGFGTFDLLARMPGRFAAAAPICGGGNVAVVGLYAAGTSLWIFHGAKDYIVPVENSRKMYEALKKRGADVRYTEYPDADHNSWDPAFAEPDFLEWMFSKRLK